MVQILIGTNRPESKSLEIGKICQQLLIKSQPSQIISLADVHPEHWVNSAMYEKAGLNEEIENLRNTHLIPFHDWIIICPEYNGSIPGILKLFLDMLSVNKAKETFNNKKIGLIGVSSGRAGNLRGLDHLTSILHYLNANVMPFKLPVSSVNALMDNKLETSTDLTNPLNDFLDRYLDFTKK